MGRTYFNLCTALMLVGTAPALAEDVVRPGPAGTAKSPTHTHESRYVILELHQPQRDLNDGDPGLNMMFDAREGRSWVLRYGRLPGGNELGYIWAEVPRVPAAKLSKRK